MLVDVGFYALFATVLLALWAAGAYLVGGLLGDERWSRSGRRALIGVFALAALASLALVRAIVAGDYSVEYVAEVSNRALPALYKPTAFWAGMDGSMLLWLLFLSAQSALAAWSIRGRFRDLTPWIGLSLSVTVLFFAVLVAFFTNPLARGDFVPADGRGMNPALQNYWMAIHPPTLYVGYTGLAIPFAFAFAALVSGRIGEEWIIAARRWVLVPWLALGMGMIFGGRWAYEELGWGGYWAWDPVENASLMPWLMTTAYLHSVLVQERRGMFRTWNMILIMSAFALSIFGTFITRSGLIESVHSFAESEIGWWFAGFVALILATSAALLFYRWPELKTPHHVDSLLSREFSFMLNNLAFVSLTLVTLFLTMYPVVSEIWTGSLKRLGLRDTVEKWTVGVPAFNQINGSIGLLLLVLTGIGPVISWRRASTRSLRRNFTAPAVAGVVVGLGLYALGYDAWMSLAAWSGATFVCWCVLSEFHRGARVVGSNRGIGYVRGLGTLFSRNRRRYGGYVVHLGVAMFFIGVAGMAFRVEKEAALMPGDVVEVHGYRVAYVEPVAERRPGTDARSVLLEISRDGRPIGELRPEFLLHDHFPNPEKNVGILQTVSGDLYAILAEPPDAVTGRAKMQVLWNPLVAWVWGGGWVLLAGSLACLWPGPGPRAAAGSGRVARAA